MRTAPLLLTALRSQTSISTILSISERSQKERSKYYELLKSEQWQELSRVCLDDIHRTGGDVVVLTDGIREVRAITLIAKLGRKELEEAVAAMEAAERPDSARGSDGAFDPTALREALRHEFVPDGYGKFHLASADDLVRLQSAALQCLIQAELHQASGRARDSEHTAQFVTVILGSSEVSDFSRAVANGRAALNMHYQRVYLATLNDKAALLSRLNDVMSWVMRNIRDLCAIQSAISLLASGSDAAVEQGQPAAMKALVIDAGMLIREAVAAYLTSLVSVLAINGVHHLKHNVVDVLSRASTTALHGRLAAGKRTSLSRLNRLPDGMFVAIEGIVTEAKVVKTKGTNYLLVSVRDVEASSRVSVLAPVNLLVQGIREGCEIRASGYFRKTGSPLFRQKHVELETLKIDEVYAQDIWKIAFLNLSTPYFNMWPTGLHIELQLLGANVSIFTQPNKGSPPLGATGPCDAEQKNAQEKQEDYDVAHQSCKAALEFYAAALLGMWAGCTALLIWTGGQACGIAIIALKAALDSLNSAIQAMNNASKRLQDAKQALDDCLHKGMGSVGPQIGGDGPATNFDLIFSPDLLDPIPDPPPDPIPDPPPDPIPDPPSDPTYV
jgi:hypothetical protein